MKLKILLAPVTLLASMVIFIWLVYPAFSNPTGGDGVKEEYQKLQRRSLERDAKINRLEDGRMFSVFSFHKISFPRREQIDEQIWHSHVNPNPKTWTQTRK